MADAPNVEQQAREMGWRPKEQFQGDESKWVDAETFVKRGEEIMPILKSQNKRLHGEVSQLQAQLAETAAAVKAGQEAIESLKTGQIEITKAAVARAKSEIRGRLREAREANDMDLVGQLEDQLDDIRDAEREVKNAPAKAPAPAPAPAVDPAFTEWHRENPWYGTDRRRTALMVAEATEMRADPANRSLVGRAFYEKAAENVDAILTPRAPTKVETGSGTGSPSGSGGGSGGKRAYRDLPAEAKAVCDRQAEAVVGKGRAYKTQAEWQQAYADLYFQE